MPDPSSDSSDGCEITCVVGPQGVWGGGSGEGDTWEAQFSAVVWKDAEGQLHRDGLYVTCEATEEFLEEFAEKVAPYQVIRLRAQLRKHPGAERLHAVMIHLEEAHAFDAELQAIADELQKPVEVQTRKFGTFTLDRSLGWYEAEVGVGDLEFDLRLNPNNVEEPDEVLAQAEKLWDLMENWDRLARDCAAKELLELKNSMDWREEDEPEITAEEFKTTMDLESVIISEDGTFVFWYDDGDLFFGNDIEVTGSFAEGFTSANV